MPTVLKFDIFPSSAFPLGAAELDRAVSLDDTALSKWPVRFVTPEDILLAKLYWFRTGGEVSEVQWRDVQGLVRASFAGLDRAYLEQGATTLGVRDLLFRVLPPA